MDGFWLYDLPRRDFFCNDFAAVVEMSTSAITVEIESNSVHLPVSWYTIVCDKHTGAVDTIQIHELTNTKFKMFCVGPKLKTVTETGYRVTNFIQSRTFFYPVFSKQQLLCVAITPSKWIFVTPNDTYQKHIKHISPAELMM